MLKNKHFYLIVFVLAVLFFAVIFWGKPAVNGRVADNNQNSIGKAPLGRGPEPTQYVSGTGTPEAHHWETEFKDIDSIPVWPEQIYSEADYEGWQTFMYEDLGYTLKYPPDWRIEDQREGSTAKAVYFKPHNPEPFMGYFGVSLELRSLELARKTLYGKEEKIIFNGHKAFQFTYDNHARIIIIPYKGKILSIGTDKQDMPEIKQIMASFEFID